MGGTQHPLADSETEEQLGFTKCVPQAASQSLTLSTGKVQGYAELNSKTLWLQFQLDPFP